MTEPHLQQLLSSEELQQADNLRIHNLAISPMPRVGEDVPSVSPPDPDEQRSISGARSELPGLCARCAELCKSINHALDNLPPGFDDIYSDAPFSIKIADVGQNYRTQFNVGDLGTIMKYSLYDQTVGWLRSTCNLCLMLSNTLVWEFNDPGPFADELHLLRLNTHLIFHIVRGGIDMEALRRHSPLYLSVINKNFDFDSLADFGDLNWKNEVSGFTTISRRGQVSEAVSLPILVHSRFDKGLAHKWLGYCQNHHQGPCLSKAEMVTGLCLIDCHAQTVVAAPADAEYVALSYCWGEASEGSRWLWWWTMVGSSQDPFVHPDSAESNGGVLYSLPSNVPAVISDAMKVTMSLGYSYLWVDRYCIDQKSSSKHTQISQMDSIYQRAELTIIAAAGKDPSYGLPGVGLRPRKQQLACSGGDNDFICTMQDPQITIEASAWHERAWTFQEGALSRRRLVFTDEQVYYECAAMNCYESMSSDLDSLHIEDKTRFRDCLRSGLFGREPNSRGKFDKISRTPEQQMDLLRSMIEQYTNRSLSYDTDSLNGFVGILRRFEQSSACISNIWGLPVYRKRKVGAEIDDSVAKFKTCFVASLSWYHRIHPAVHGRRRQNFPSWAWCGWAGAVSYTLPPTECSLHSMFFENKNGDRLTPIEYLDNIDPRRSYAFKPAALWIEGLILPQSAITTSYEPPEKSVLLSEGPHMNIFGFQGHPQMSTGPWNVREKYESLGEGGSRHCVFLGTDFDGGVLHFIILEDRDGNWERIGMIGLDVQSGPRKFWKKWVDYETNSSVPIDDIEKCISELPARSFRIV